ncbi:MAG: hypothetical protein E6G97_20950 [Alphaproteobacteria bacterium]|nr:MAG: hypothetical protein E6G97_20950 [Alphaproteobacteria bacterium]
MKVVNALRDLDQAKVITAAAAALATTFGEAVDIRNVRVLSSAERRNLILRGIAIRDSGQDRSIIIKATRSGAYDPTAADAFDEFGLVREWVATAFLSAQAPARGHGALFLAGDVQHGVLVFEDLGAELDSLVGPLLHGKSDAAERALMAYALALGRLHADTVTNIVEHGRALQTCFPAASRNPPRDNSRLEEIAVQVCNRIGGAPPRGDVAQIAKRLDEPGIWNGLVHGDPCPDNALLQNSHVRLIDYEFAGPGHVLLDAAYWRIGFPTCWCAGRIPDPIVARVEAAYRSQLGAVLGSEVNDTVFHSEMALMAAVWLLRRLAMHLDTGLKEDRMWGIASIRSRLLWYLDVTIAMTEAAEVLPEFRSVARAWSAELRTRWPSSGLLSLYPAFVHGSN